MEIVFEKSNKIILLCFFFVFGVTNWHLNEMMENCRSAENAKVDQGFLRTDTIVSDGKTY